MDPFYKRYEKSAFFYIYFMCFCVSIYHVIITVLFALAQV